MIETKNLSPSELKILREVELENEEKVKHKAKMAARKEARRLPVRVYKEEYLLGTCIMTVIGAFGYVKGIDYAVISTGVIAGIGAIASFIAYVARERHVIYDRKKIMKQEEEMWRD